MNTPMPPPPPPKPGPPSRPKPPARAEATFNSALERPPAEREAFVAQACGDDTVLVAEVRGMLAANEGAGDFPKAEAPHSPEVERELARLKPEESGDRIGPYKLLQQIGEGGFGTVWMAEQEQPVRRRVALKIIKLGMDTKEVIARFEQERQALAMMDHPNIAKVFDAGATQFGRPFFVMELVRGVKITEYCDEHGMPTADRLRLFILVCQAVQHAHQKGIVHRDIKPSNVLVTVNDGAPVPKVIDFGVAKAMQGRLTDRTLFTQFEQMVGTPLYMSPEQAEMSSLDIDTRSDIYSLGVLLYELLTGRTPIEAATIQQAGMDEIRRIIREVDPLRPSLRMATLDGAELTSAGNRRHTDPAKLPGALRGDLDWVVMKCIEKARDRRYETANALALDIQRHLANEPIAARPPGSLYRLQKLIRRNKLAFAAGSAVVAALIIGLGFATFSWIKERQARERAVAAEHEQVRLRGHAEKSREEAEKSRQQAETARASEAAQRERAEQTAAEETRQRERAEAVTRDLETQRAEELFAADDAATGIASLAQVLRRDPSNRVAAERLISALTHRNFLIPTIPPLKLDAAPAEDFRTALSFNVDGERVITPAGNKAVIWNVRTGELVGEPLTQKGRVTSARFSPDGSLAATASTDGTARVWDAETGQPVTEPLRHAKLVREVNFSTDGERVVTCSDDKTARIWDAHTGLPLSEPLQHEAEVRSAQFNSYGKRIVTTSGKVAVIWDSQTGKKIGEPILHPGYRDSDIVYYAVFSPDGRKIITRSSDASVRIWDALTGLPIGKPFHSIAVTSARFSRDGRSVVTASSDGTAGIWDASTGQKRLSLRHRGGVTSAQFSLDGNQVLTASRDHSARLWDAHTGQPLSEPMRQGDVVSSAEFSPDNWLIATVSLDRTVCVWDARPNRASSLEIKHKNFLHDAGFSPDGKRVVTACQDKIARIWDSHTGAALTESLPHRSPVLSASFSSDGERILTSGQMDLRIWSARDGKSLVEFPEAVGSPTRRSTHFSADGNRLLTVTATNGAQFAQIFDAHTGQVLVGPFKDSTSLAGARFSPDGLRLVTASRSARAGQIWDAVTGRRLVGPLQHSEWVVDADWSADGSRVVTASEDQTAQVWDAGTGERLGKPLRHLGPLISVRFSPDGLRVVTASQDQTARVWDARTGQPLGEPLKHGKKVLAAEFSPDGQRIVTASDDKTARVWDVRTSQPLAEPFRHANSVVTAHFSPDGQRVLTASWDRSARIWEVPVVPLPVPDWVPALAESVGGRRFNAQGITEAVPIAELMPFKKRFTESPATDFHTRWAQWFFADRATRHPSPYAPAAAAK